MSEKRPVRVFVNAQGEIEVDGLVPERTPEQQAKRKKIITQYGHIKRKLLKGERLKGELLELAVSCARGEEFANKLRHGEKFTDYEMHLMLDVYLLHARLAA